MTMRNRLFHCQNPDVLTASSDYSSFLEKATAGFERIQKERRDRQSPVLDIVYKTDDLASLQETAQDWIKRFKTFIVLGTGGSSLGAQTLCALHQSLVCQLSSCRLLFMDNVDPHTFAALVSALDFQETGFLVISKSGTTAETICQLLTILPHYTPSSLREHIFILTEPTSSPLRQIAQHYGLRCFNHHSGIGGRFSVFTNVGLLPAAVAGVDISRVRLGACHVLEHPRHALEGAALAATAYHKGYTQSVLMPYIDRLYHFTFWFRQLWAESLGKAGKGTTPLNALGTVDQHSQLQLYLDGPQDKLFTLILMDVAHQGTRIEIPANIPDLDYLAQKTMGDLMAAEQKATVETLMNRERPTRVFSLSGLDEEIMGGLLMHYMLETMLTAELLGVNAFDQPAVEEGKVLTRDYLKSL